jgi:2-polyprenyl-3-methyl-5-hydroxy-6-metoxy-1,4-benzoquinol methylase
MGESVDKVREDFDRIARLTAGDPEPLALYDRYLLREIPRSLHRVLEVGCGTGGFSRALADRGHRVTAVDLSPEMVRVARQRTSAAQDVTYLCGDLFGDSLDAQTYECVVTIATLHHLPLDAAVQRLSRMVEPGGTLLVHDIRSDAGIADGLRLPLAVGARVWTRVRAGRLRERAAVRAAWDEHGREERYLTMAEVAVWCRAYLPGARIIRHLQWRYTVVWRKPTATHLSPPADRAR